VKGKLPAKKRKMSNMGDNFLPRERSKRQKKRCVWKKEEVERDLYIFGVSHLPEGADAFKHTESLRDALEKQSITWGRRGGNSTLSEGQDCSFQRI